MGRLLFHGRRSYPHPIRERNGKAPWLHRLLFQGHRSHPHPIRERNGKLVCTSCSCQGTDHILTQLGRRMGRLLGCIGCFSRAQIISSPNAGEEWEGFWSAAGRLLGCIGCFFTGTDHILTQLGRGMRRLLGCIGCFFQGTDHILAQLGRGIGRLLDCIWRGTDHAHPITKRNGKAPWLHRLLLPGPRSYPRPIRERNRKAPGLHLEGHRSCSPGYGAKWEGSLAASAAFARAQIISSPN